MKVLKSFSNTREGKVLSWYIASLEEWMMQNGGKDYLESLAEEFYTHLMDLTSTELQSQGQKLGSA